MAAACTPKQHGMHVWDQNCSLPTWFGPAPACLPCLPMPTPFLRSKHFLPPPLCPCSVPVWYLIIASSSLCCPHPHTPCPSIFPLFLLLLFTFYLLSFLFLQSSTPLPPLTFLVGQCCHFCVFILQWVIVVLLMILLTFGERHTHPHSDILFFISTYSGERRDSWVW